MFYRFKPFDEELLEKVTGGMRLILREAKKYFRRVENQFYSTKGNTFKSQYISHHFHFFTLFYMKRLTIFLTFSVFTISVLATVLFAQTKEKGIQPVQYVYKIAGDSLKAFVFSPDSPSNGKSYPAIAIFHGGGWFMGEPSWGFWHAENFAKRGFVAIAIQYRLSNQKDVTPIEAVQDAEDAIIWIKNKSQELNIDKEKVVEFGWSAGAHLAACTATFPKKDANTGVNSIPRALVLQSPALSVVDDKWFATLLLNKADPLTYSPAEHIKGKMPASIIVVGKDDTVTPVKESELFHQNMLKYKNSSKLFVYDGVGHMFTPSTEDDKGYPHPDKEIEQKAFAEIDLFLKNEITDKK